MQKTAFSFRNPLDLLFLTKTLAFAAAFLLSIVSILGICTESCKEGLTYTLYGVHFEVIGIVLFSAATTLCAFSRTNPLLRLLTAYTICGAVGGELILLYVQRYLIKHWCPVCLAIAACVGIAALALLIESRIRLNKLPKEERMKQLWKGISSISCIFVGFFLIFSGIAKEDAFADAGESIQRELALGNLDSSVKIYLFTDWHCPACRTLEASLEKMAPMLLDRTALTFVDIPMHPESLNFTPYNLSFLVKNKPEYLQIRKILEEIALETNSPTEEQIQKAVAPLGIDYQQLNYSEIALAIRYYRDLARQFQIDSTPTMAIVHKGEMKGKKLKGLDQITADNIQRTLEMLEGLHEPPLSAPQP